MQQRLTKIGNQLINGKGIVTFLLITLCFFGNAQQQALYTHYSFNTLGVNPGYAGSRDVLTVTGLHRSQWISFPGAPTTQTLTVHAPAFSRKIGLGATFINDQAGPTRNTGLSIDIAYKIRVGNKGKLAFGLKGGVDLVGNDLSSIAVVNGNDPNFQQGTQNLIIPNFGFGLYYSQPKFYAGLSSPRLLQNSLQVSELGEDIEQRHFYAITGTIMDLNQVGSIKLKPTALIKLTAGAPIQMDLTALIYYKDFLWVGPMFRTTDAFGLLVGIKATKQFSIGYSFDWSYGNTTGRYNGGSHELMLRYDFIFKDKLGIESPRYF